ncbi:RND family efflux transporter MFP subunit [Pedobacter psychrotolerans]|uniref:MexH family multidrug efflux RND transporter periplasmic adaptor subunit n=1 Tax=Pedobacter psychrotolerans TaxID=1843235 RepID=A0A4R2H6Y7_9SPHI|nr:efflux RND transporter periplasmic adaptor subunit [Pedobacter psychrotolerans]TCO21612.1 RND family efflux transporter MFP subunit [Pedobacter psychrotolerans]GGE39902.1 MexH family multidrug efflux RND transporter periplasmic adaptor subunit [Pedobacter psychrotolerans]
MKAKRIITIIVIVAVPVAIIIGLMTNKKKLDDAKQPVDRSNIGVKVTIDTVLLKTVDGSVTQPATLITDNDANVAAETAGKISSLSIQLGTTVKKGQVIGRIDVTENQQKLEAAVLSITKLTSDYERNKVLLAGNATNANAVTDAKYDLDAKKLEAAQLRTQISRANIIAPSSGVITDRQKIAGEYVTTGTTIAIITNVNTLKANVSVPESQVLYIKKGQKAMITSDSYPGETFTGTVNYVSPKGDDNHNYTVQLAIANTGAMQLKAGLYVNVEFTYPTTKQSFLMINKNALTDGVKNPAVFVFKSGVVEKRKLVTGTEHGDDIEVKSGLSAGELVVTSGQINLSDGSKAQIIKVK